MPLHESTIEKLKSELRGELIQPLDSSYDQTRKVYNGMIDRRPRMIARCANVADVINSVNFARDLDLLLAIRGGGHNGPGFGTCDEGLVIDLSRMRGVRVDPVERTARVEGGCLVVYAGIDPDPANDDRVIAWTKNYWAALHPYSTVGGYLNFMMDEGQDSVKATYGDNYNRLASIKKKYDPSNLFRVNQNIKPAP